MKRLTLTLSLALMAAPVWAAGKDVPFFSLKNTDFIVLISFLIFIGVLVYFKVPDMLTGLLDKRAETIRGELDEARALREEAQTLLASFERKQAEVQEQADRIVAQAKEEAEMAATQAKDVLEQTIARRLQAASDQIASAEAGAVKEVRDQAVTVAVAAAGDVLAAQMTAKSSDDLISAAIEDVGSKLH